MIQAIIVDDEPLARKGIIQLLASHKDIEIVAQCEDGVSAIEQIELRKPDLVFMDIQMPEIDGFEVIDNLKLKTKPLIIFITAYDEYALKAFQTHAVDYLLKPVNEIYFEKALQRIRLLTHAKNNPELSKRLNTLLGHVRQQPEFIERFLIRENNKLLIIHLNSVDIFTAHGDYVQLNGPKRKHLIRETLSKLEQKLDPALFVRVNRSTILRKSLINNLEPISKGDYRIILTSKQTFKLSRNYRAQVMDALKK